MLQKVKISTKINLGFAAVVFISVILGLIAIFSMNNGNSKATVLSEQVAPMVEVANNVERSALLTMYEIRKYGYIQDEAALAKGRTHLTDVKKALKEAKELSTKYNIGLLSEKEKIASEYTDEYIKLLDDTVVIQRTMDQAKKDSLEAAKQFSTAIYSYLDTNSSDLKKEIAGGKTKEAETTYRNNALANDVIDAGNAIQLGVWMAIASRDPKLFEEQYKKFEIIYKKTDDIFSNEEKSSSRDLLKTVKLSAENYKLQMDKFLKAWYSNEEMFKKRAESGEKVTRAAEETALYGVESTKETSNNVSITLKTALWVLSIGLLICFVIAIFLAFLTSKNINTALNKTTNELASASGQVVEAARQLSNASQELSSSSSEQASAVEETSSSLEEISGMIENNLRNAEKTKELADQVKKVADRGNESMSDLINSMKDILDSNTKIEELVRVIGEIGEKTKVIDEIVFQTKLLSFNASVEAERAGEHGRGFAVVAQEVGNLAQMSGKAALEISSIVNHSIKNAQIITQENKQKVESGNGLVQETALILKEAAESAKIVSSNTVQVLNSSKEQETGIKQIGNAMDQINKATQQNASIAEEAASSSEELSAQGENLRQLVNELVGMVRGQEEAKMANYEQHRSHSSQQIGSGHPHAHSDSSPHHGDGHTGGVLSFQKKGPKTPPHTGMPANNMKMAAGGENSHPTNEGGDENGSGGEWERL